VIRLTGYGVIAEKFPPQICESRGATYQWNYETFRAMFMHSSPSQVTTAVHDFASIAEPLTRLTKKNTIFKWTEEADLAFCRLKQALLDATTLAFPVPGLPYILDSDASDVAVGAVLSQVVDGGRKTHRILLQDHEFRSTKLLSH